MEYLTSAVREISTQTFLHKGNLSFKIIDATYLPTVCYYSVINVTIVLVVSN